MSNPSDVLQCSRGHSGRHERMVIVPRQRALPVRRQTTRPAHASLARTRLPAERAEPGVAPHILMLQHHLGNAAVARLLLQRTIQRDDKGWGDATSGGWNE